MPQPTFSELRPAEPNLRAIYLIRHGATVMNRESAIGVSRARGWKNVPLSPEGRREAQWLATSLRESNITHLGCR
jgi:broad specificity phosphatase PhoE